MNDILKSLKMSQEEFLFLCILCGNDFNHNVPKYGPIKCYSLIKQYGVFKSKLNDPIKITDDDDEIKILIMSFLMILSILLKPIKFFHLLSPNSPI